MFRLNQCMCKSNPVRYFLSSVLVENSYDVTNKRNIDEMIKRCIHRLIWDCTTYYSIYRYWERCWGADRDRKVVMIPCDVRDSSCSSFSVLESFSLWSCRSCSRSLCICCCISLCNWSCASFWCLCCSRALASLCSWSCAQHCNRLDFETIAFQKRSYLERKNTPWRTRLLFRLLFFDFIPTMKAWPARPSFFFDVM